MNRQTNMNEAQMQQRIKELEKKLAYYEDNCTIVWGIEDVEAVCRDYGFNRPTINEARDFLDYLEREYNAEIGMCWDSIANHLIWLSHEVDESMNEYFPVHMPDYYYENLQYGDWGDHPLNNREGVEYR